MGSVQYSVRRPSHAGSWYSADPTQLAGELDGKLLFPQAAAAVDASNLIMTMIVMLVLHVVILVL
jgi:predicted class III extradiol MEMO1 family dioxygenase